MSLKGDLKKADIVIKKKVKLISGNIADFYCNFKKVYQDPKLLNKIADALTDKIKDQPTCIASTGHGGIPLATLVSNKINLPLTLVREEKRKHGLKKQIEGYIPSAKDRVIIIDDVCTYGTSLMKVADILKETKSKILGCCVVILRPEMKLPFKYRINYLIKAEVLFNETSLTKQIISDKI